MGKYVIFSTYQDTIIYFQSEKRHLSLTAKAWKEFCSSLLWIFSFRDKKNWGVGIGIFYFGLDWKIPKIPENPGIGIGIWKSRKNPEWKIPKSRGSGFIFSGYPELVAPGFGIFIPAIRDFFSLGISIPGIRDFS